MDPFHGGGGGGERGEGDNGAPRPLLPLETSFPLHLLVQLAQLPPPIQPPQPLLSPASLPLWVTATPSPMSGTLDEASCMLLLQQQQQQQMDQQLGGASQVAVHEAGQTSAGSSYTDHDQGPSCFGVSLGELGNGSTSSSSGTGAGRGGKAKAPKRASKPRFAFQTRSSEDILDDGYRWRKYGQKAVKNSAFPRSYYRCTHNTCDVKKQIQRLSKDSEVVVTTYEGVHNHPSEKLMETLSPVLKQLQLLSQFLAQTESCRSKNQ